MKMQNTDKIEATFLVLTGFAIGVWVALVYFLLLVNLGMMT